ncbi:MAG: zinc metallopeptidase [Verrucomicrobiota bacterium]
MNYILLVMLPGLVLGGLASLLTKTTFSKYSKVGSRRGLTGAEAARQLLQQEGIHDVEVEPVQGFLSDHYDPRAKKLRLSPDVYQSPSLSAIGVACHEAGHAIQDARNYAPLTMRSAMVPITQFGSSASYLFILGGLFLNMQPLLLLGVGLFSIAVLFSLVTLPVEWDATARAKRLMVSSGIVTADEQVHAGKVLNAAFLTYVASAVTAILTLLYYL